MWSEKKFKWIQKLYLFSLWWWEMGKMEREKRKANKDKLSPSQQSTVLEARGTHCTRPLFPISILWAHLSSPAPVGSASMWIASQCQAGHSLLFWEPSPSTDVHSCNSEGQGGLYLKDKSTHGKSWWINHPVSTASDGLILEPLPCLLRASQWGWCPGAYRCNSLTKAYQGAKQW